ncbi:MAG TPA: hypothetical protein VKT73_16580, partial [Xanthobacteraceae bacterium]|nr:hypothetical protein [Xanthobacteraceae bacterium]
MLLLAPISPAAQSMIEKSSAAPDHPTWSLDGLRLGAVQMAPALPGMMAFAVAIGATEARKGFALADALLMN